MPFVSRNKTTYVGIVDGKFSVQAEEGEPGAVERKIIDKTTGRVSKTKWEFIHPELMCFIDGIGIYDGKFGEQVVLKCHDNSQEYSIQMSKNSRYVSNLMQRIVGVDPSKPVTLAPYSFKNERDKTIQGITIYQDGVKITNQYKDKDGNFINGHPEYPTLEETKDWDGDDWSHFFKKCDKFTIKKAMEIDWDVEKTEEIPSNISGQRNVNTSPKPSVKDTLKMHEMAQKSAPKHKVEEEPNEEDDLPF